MVQKLKLLIFNLIIKRIWWDCIFTITLNQPSEIVKVKATAILDGRYGYSEVTMVDIKKHYVTNMIHSLVSDLKDKGLVEVIEYRIPGSEELVITTTLNCLKPY